MRRTPNQTDSDVTCSRSCDQGKLQKRIERQSGLRKTRILKKPNPPVSLLNPFFRNERGFSSLLKKTQKPHSESFLLHHTTSLFSELHNNNLLYLFWHSN